MKKVLAFLGFALFFVAVAAFTGNAETVFSVATMALAAAPLAISLDSPSHTRLKAQKELRGKLHKQMKDLNDLAVKEDRGFTADEDTKYQKIGDDFDKTDKEIRRLETEIQRDADLATVDLEREEKRAKGETRDEAKEKYNTAFRSWLAGGFQSLNSEQVALLNEQRTLSTTTGSQGGYTIPEGFVQKLEVALKAFGGMYSAATVIKTATGNQLPWPTVNDTTNIGEQISESANAGTTSVDPSFGVINFNAYVYSSKAILVPNDLLQDSAFSLDNHIVNMAAQRIGRILNQKFTTGTGTDTPKGLITAATSSAITAAAVAAITFDELIDLFHSVDNAYRGNGKWMFTDSTLKALRKIKDGESRPIWQVGYAAGEPSTILGKPYIVNDDMADMAASAKAVLFGDLSKYQVREVAGGSLRRVVERFVEFNQTGYYLFKRFDGDLVDAGTNPVKYLTMAAS